MGFQCPHCNQDLGIDSRALKDAWFFARCFQCGGFAMLKQGEPVREGRKPAVIPGRRKKIIEPTPLSAVQEIAQNLAPALTVQPPPFNRNKLIPKVTVRVEDAVKEKELPKPLPALSLKKSRSLQIVPFLTAIFATLIVSLGIRLAKLSDRIHTTAAHPSTQAQALSTETKDSFSLDHLAHYEGETTEELRALIRAQTVIKASTVKVGSALN